MISVSNAFKTALENDDRNYTISAEITLSDNTTLTITNSELWSQGFSVERAISSNSNFDIGGFIIGRMTLIINNIDETYTHYDFYDADVNVTLTHASTSETIAYNNFIVDEADDNASQITLTCLDRAHLFERPYSESTLAYPATANEIVNDACNHCGVTFPQATIVGGGTTLFTVQNKPDTDGLTYLKVVSWVAQMTGNYALINSSGQLKIGWYDTYMYENTPLISGAITDTETRPILDVDNEAPIQDVSSTGGTANGDDWTIGGNFPRYYHHIHSWAALKVGTDDVVITGIKVSATDDQNNVTSYQSGSDGYVLEITGNDLIATDKVQGIATYIGNKVIGLIFRAYNGNCLGNPSIEPGDFIWITDHHNRSYKSLITGTTFNLGQYQSIYCGAATPLKNSASRYSAITRAIVESRKTMNRELTSYDQKVQAMTELISRGFGMYFTKVAQADGSVIPYIHNEPTIEESSFICYMTSQGVMMQVDGETTSAVDRNGNALVKTLTARGVNADWINTGTIRSQDGTVSIDLDNNTINFNGVTTFNNFLTASDVGASGTTTIDGDRITTGVIQSQDQNVVLTLSNNGSFTMKKGTIRLGSSTEYLNIGDSGAIDSVYDTYKLKVWAGRLTGNIGNTVTGVLDLNQLTLLEDGLNNTVAAIDSNYKLTLNAKNNIDISIGSTGMLNGNPYGSGTRTTIVKITSNLIDCKKNVSVTGTITATGNITATTGGITANSLHANNGYSGQVLLPISFYSDGTIHQYATVNVTDGVIIPITT